MGEGNPPSPSEGAPGLKREDFVYVLGKEGSRRPHGATWYLLRLLLFLKAVMEKNVRGALDMCAPEKGAEFLPSFTRMF